MLAQDKSFVLRYGMTTLREAWDALGHRPSLDDVAASVAALDWQDKGFSQRYAGRYQTVTISLSCHSISASMSALSAWPVPEITPEDNKGHRGGSMKRPWTFAHFLWSLIAPCVKWAESEHRALSPWTPAHDHCLHILAEDFIGVDVDSVVEDEMMLADHGSLLLSTHLDIDMPADVLLSTLKPLWDDGLPQTSMAVSLVLMSQKAMAPLIGDALHAELLRCLLASATGLQKPAPVEPLEAALKRELVGHLVRGHTDSNVWSDDENLDTAHAPAAKRRRTEESLQESLGAKTDTLRLALTNKVGLTHVLKTVVGAHELICKFKKQELDCAEHLALEEQLHSRHALARHMLLLDSALDAHTKDRLQRHREMCGEGFAVGLATDESPPSQSRFGGYRFQVTVLYVPVWEPEDLWDTCAHPPLGAESIMLDICHCPGKDGKTVMSVLDKQMDRAGISRFDVVSVTGDGGGETKAQQESTAAWRLMSLATYGAGAWAT